MISSNQRVTHSQIEEPQTCSDEEESKWRIPRSGIRVENHEDTITSIIPNAYFLSTGCVCYTPLVRLFLFLFSRKKHEIKRKRYMILARKFVIQ